jgi:hypothetical protein
MLALFFNKFSACFSTFKETLMTNQFYAVHYSSLTNLLL